MFIFLDESGDLGFDFNNLNTTKKFVITLLVCDNRAVVNQFSRAVLRAKKSKLRRSSWRFEELKGVSTSLKVKNYFFRSRPYSGWRVYAVVLDKERAYGHLKKNLNRSALYNCLARFLIGQLHIPTTTNAVNLIIDRSKTRREIKDFDTYIGNHLKGLISVETPLFITHELSQNNPGLQAADLFSWGIFRKHEREDDEWYSFFSEWIIFEDEYLPRNDEDGP
ncbi:MAG: DUF3800 domain-containing protein [Desulfomonilaceae bacterium]